MISSLVGRNSQDTVRKWKRKIKSSQAIHHNRLFSIVTLSIVIISIPIYSNFNTKYTFSFGIHQYKCKFRKKTETILQNNNGLEVLNTNDNNESSDLTSTIFTISKILQFEGKSNLMNSMSIYSIYRKFETTTKRESPHLKLNIFSTKISKVIQILTVLFKSALFIPN